MKYEQKNGQLYITGGFSDRRILEIPERTQDGPVTGIDRYAFRDRTDLLEVVLPSTVFTVGGHAFYNCKNMTRLTLHDGVRELEDGAFKNCYRLKEIVLYCHQGREGCIRNLMSENTQELILTVVYDGGEQSKIVFPTFEDDYVENTPARIFQAVSFGTGGMYRQCMQSGTLDYREIDRLFERSVREDRFEAGLYNAVFRLLHPYRLFASAKERYERFLSENDCRAGEILIDERRTEAVRLLCERGLLSESATPKLIEAAQRADDPAMTGMLIHYGLTRFQKNRKKFDL